MPSVTLEAALILALTLVVSIAAFTQTQNTLLVGPRICQWNSLSQINAAVEAALLAPMSKQSVAIPFTQTISTSNHEIRSAGCEQPQPDIVDPLRIVTFSNTTAILYSDGFNITQAIIVCPTTIVLQYYPFNRTLSIQ
jgi:hypothetical protein